MIKEIDLPIGDKPLINSIAGTIPGVATRLAQAPKHLANMAMGGYNLLQGLYHDEDSNWPEMPRIPQEAFKAVKESYPGAKKMQRALGVDRSGYWENLADKSIAGAGEFLAMGGNPGSWAKAGTQMAKFLPIVAGGEVASDVLKPLGPTAQTIGQLGTMAVMPWVGKGIMKGVSKLPGVATQFGKKAVEGAIPLAKEVGKALSDEQKAALKQIREHEKKVASNAKITAKEQAQHKKNLEIFKEENLATRQQELEAQRFKQKETELKVKEHQDLKSELDAYNAENITGESKLDAEVLKRREQTKNAVDKYQAENDALMSKQDADALKAKIDAGEQATLPQAVEEDINKARKELLAGAEEVENLKTLEGVVSETFGAKPKELRTRMSNLYKSFRDSLQEKQEYYIDKRFPEEKYFMSDFDFKVMKTDLEGDINKSKRIFNQTKSQNSRFAAKQNLKLLEPRLEKLNNFEKVSSMTDIKTSAKKMQAVNSLLKESIEEGIPTSSKDLILKEVIQPIEAKIKDGQISVRDLAAIRQDINEKIREIYKKNGSLERYEKNLPRFNHTVDEMLEAAAKDNPGMKLGDFKEANKIARNMSQTSDIARWAQESMKKGKLGKLSRIVGDPILYANNPQVSKWFNRAVRKFASGEIRAATRNLVAADKEAAKALEEKSAKPINIGEALGKAAPIAQEGKVIEFNL